MPNNYDSLSKEDKLKAIQDAFEKATSNDAQPDRRPMMNFVPPQATPLKPDPEAMAQALMSSRMNAQKAPQAQQAPAQASPEDQQDDEQRMLRMQALQQMSGSGQMPAYLNKIQGK